MKANTVGKMNTEVRRAYLAGFIDGDGCIMATIERHSEKRFGFRVRVEVKITQKDSRLLKNLAREFNMGNVSCNRRDTDHATYDWSIRDKEDAKTILDYIRPYSRLKQEQICIALKILEKVIATKKDLLRNARLADSLSWFNVRSKNRRKNFAAMIKAFISPND